MANWEETDGKQVNYWYVGKTGFTVGSHHGSGHSDNATHYEIAKMLDPLEMYYIKKWHLPPSTTYKEVLEQLINAIHNESKYSDCSKELALIPDIEAFIADLPAMEIKGNELAEEALKKYRK